MGTHAQLGNTDTMGDIISGTLGGLAAILVWAVAAVAGCICLIALVNVLDMFLDNNEMG